MDKAQFDAVFPVLCADLVRKLSAELQIKTKEAICLFYSSLLYEKLEQEETKVWHYSTEKLFDLYMQERTCGCINFPDV
jgi:hypothetical protein